MKKIIKQIPSHEVYNVVYNIHNIDDFEDGDIGERLEKYDYYNHINDYFVAALNNHSYHIDEDKVDEIVKEIKEKGLSTMPKIVIDPKGDPIDGVHRAAALSRLNILKIDVLKGTNKKHIPLFKKELEDEVLSIYKISNNFGSISISENINSVPSKHSVVSLFVEEKNRGLGIGSLLLKEAMSQYEDLDVKVSSIPELKVFLSCGFEPKDLETKIKGNIDLLSYDFKTFSRDKGLLSTQTLMYKNSIDIFDKKLKESTILFNKNYQELYLKDMRSVDLKIKPKSKQKRTF